MSTVFGSAIQMIATNGAIRPTAASNPTVIHSSVRTHAGNSRLGLGVGFSSATASPSAISPPGSISATASWPTVRLAERGLVAAEEVLDTGVLVCGNFGRRIRAGLCFKVLRREREIGRFGEVQFFGRTGKLEVLA